MFRSPEDRLIIEALKIDTLSAYGLWLEDFKEDLPKPKTYKVDIPGGDGCIDLTEALTGDIAYGRGSQKFQFRFPDFTGFDEIKHRMLNDLHGKVFDYRLSFDPDYTYTGRFTVVDDSKYSESYPTITIDIDREPYKTKGLQTIAIDHTKGVWLNLWSGRKKVQPVFEFSEDSVVVFGDDRFELPAGTYTLNEVWFSQGVNSVFLCISRLKKTSTWSDFTGMTWGQFRQQQKIIEWYTYFDKNEISHAVFKPSTSISGAIVFTATDEDGGKHQTTFNLSQMVKDTVESTEMVEVFVPELDDSGEPVLNDDNNPVGTIELQEQTVYTEREVLQEYTLLPTDVVVFEDGKAKIQRVDSEGMEYDIVLDCVLPAAANSLIVSLTCDKSGSLDFSVESKKYIPIRTKWGYFKTGGLTESLVVGVDENGSDIYRDETIDLSAAWGDMKGKRWMDAYSYVAETGILRTPEDNSALAYVQYDWSDL